MGLLLPGLGLDPIAFAAARNRLAGFCGAWPAYDRGSTWEGTGMAEDGATDGEKARPSGWRGSFAFVQQWQMLLTLVAGRRPSRAPSLRQMERPIQAISLDRRYRGLPDNQMERWLPRLA